MNFSLLVIVAISAFVDISYEVSDEMPTIQQIVSISEFLYIYLSFI